MRRSALLAAVSSMVLVAAAASAQTLGDLARQEDARRKTIATPAKVYTNDAMRSEPAPTAPAPAAGQPAAPAQTTPAAVAPAPGTPGAATPGGAVTPPGGAATPPAASAEDPKTEAYWQKRMAAVRDGLSRSQIFAEALQTRINSLSADFVNRDDPAQRTVVAAEREKALAELARVQKEIQDQQKLIVDIQDEARRAGAPAGWVR